MRGHAECVLRIWTTLETMERIQRVRCSKRWNSDRCAIIWPKVRTGPNGGVDVMKEYELIPGQLGGLQLGTLARFTLLGSPISASFAALNFNLTSEQHLIISQNLATVYRNQPIVYFVAVGSLGHRLKCF